MDRDLDVPVQCGKHLEQPVQREASQVCVAHPGKIRRRKAGLGSGLAHRELAPVHDGDDLRGEDRLALFQIRMGIVEVAEDVSASPNHFEFILSHRSISSSQPAQPCPFQRPRALMAIILHPKALES